MSKRRFSIAVCTCAATLASCGPRPVDGIGEALAACDRGARHDEIRASGPVMRVLGVRGSHEGFLVLVNFAVPGRSDRVLRAFRIEDNTDITGPIPLRNGETVLFQGQFECNDDVIHWTHRDPAGRHVDGYIEADGKTYR